MRKVRVIAELIRCLPQDGTSLLTLSWAAVCGCLALLLRMHVLPRSVMKPFSGRVSISGPNGFILLIVFIFTTPPICRPFVISIPISCSPLCCFLNPMRHLDDRRGLWTITQILDGDKCAPLRNDSPTSGGKDDDETMVVVVEDEWRWRCLVIFRFYCGTI